MKSKHKLASIVLAGALIFTTSAFASANTTPNAVAFQVVKSQLVIGKKEIQNVKLVKSRDGFYAVDVTLKPNAAKIFSNLTKDNVNKKMMITVGDNIINQAIIRSELGGKFQITTKSKQTAMKVVKALS